jgi:riboflavin transporter FmnP
MVDMDKKTSTHRLMGTAILSALVIVFDYSLKFSGLKIPFPWMPFLKFDFTGIPIILCLFLFDISSSITVTLVAGLSIMARSGDLIGASMKVIAEGSTVLGLYLGTRIIKGSYKDSGLNFVLVLISIIARVVDMSILNLIVLPNAYGMPFTVVVGMLPLLGVFNAIQGLISIFLGYFLFEAYKRRI